MSDIYVSSSNIDRETVYAVISALEMSGFSCCIPGRDIALETNWEKQVSEAVNASTIALCFHSEASAKSFRLFIEREMIDKSGIMRLDIEIATAAAETIVEMVKNSFEEAVRVKEESSRLLPYCGSERYIFASYSHRDKDKVFSIIRILQNHGYRVWFDEGIDPGTEWDDNIAEHLGGASYMIAFFSENFFGSQNCSDELHFARELGIAIMPIYLEEVELDAGTEMRFGRLQSLFWYSFRRNEDFISKVDEADGIDKCRDIDNTKE